MPIGLPTMFDPRIKRLARKGMAPKEIAALVGLNRRLIAKFLKREGVSVLSSAGVQQVAAARRMIKRGHDILARYGLKE
jgi:hypothetical protein